MFLLRLARVCHFYFQHVLTTSSVSDPCFIPGCNNQPYSTCTTVDKKIRTCTCDTGYYVVNTTQQSIQLTTTNLKFVGCERTGFFFFWFCPNYYFFSHMKNFLLRNSNFFQPGSYVTKLDAAQTPIALSLASTNARVPATRDTNQSAASPSTAPTTPSRALRSIRV